MVALSSGFGKRDLRGEREGLVENVRIAEMDLRPTRRRGSVISVQHT